MRTARGYRRARHSVIHALVRRKTVFLMAEGRCQSCGTALAFGGPWLIDLIDPDGLHIYENVRALCVTCADEPDPGQRPALS
jgi:hypothetical protein